MDKNEEFLKLWQIRERYKISSKTESAFEKKYNINSSVRKFSKHGQPISMYSVIDIEEKVVSKIKINNEELQKWLNDDRYVQTKELMILWGVTQDCVGGNLRKHNIKPSKIFHIGQGGFFCFYEKKQCLNLELGEKVKEFRETLNDNRYVQASDLAKQWGVSKGAVLSFLKSHKILPCKTLAAYASGGGGNRLFFDKHQCESIRNELKDGSIELNDWRNSDKHITVEKLAEMYNCSIGVVFHHFRKLKIKAEKTIHTGYNKYCFYDKKKAILVMSEYSRMMKNIDECESNASLIQIKDLAHAWGLHVDGVRIFLKRKGIKSAIRPCASRAYYDRAECERVRPFINQPEQKEVEKVEEKQMELPEPKEQTPDIIPADTIDLFTMSELESELKNRGVELTAEVRAKINASDMPEMQHIATMLRGNTKTIAIRLSVLNEIAGQLRKAKFVEVVKSNAGAKCKHCPEFDKIAFDMASANKTDEEIAQNLKISIDTFYRYKREITSFANALNSGKAANPFTIKDSQGKERADRYFELKDFMEMQKQLNDMQQMIEILVKKLDGVNMTEKKMFIKNGKVDKVIVTETKLEDKR